MFQKLHGRRKSQALDQPVSVTPSSSDEPIPPKQGRSLSGSSRRMSSIPKMAMKAMLASPEVPRYAIDRNDGNIPNEMIPVLTLLASHGNRIYNEGYFMILPELSSEGEPVPDRKWTEVYGTLQGTILTMWDAAQLDAGKYETSFINVTDGYMRGVDSLGPDLQNVIVLSTTMKNRFLLQFGTKKLFNEWTAALRLAAFERTSLQEAYTGALLSSKGPKLNGIRTMLMEANHRTELWCNIRFGVGMPWKRVWTVIIPNAYIKDKKERKRREKLGKVEFYSDPKDKKKRPLATIHNAFATFAVFPEKAVLMNTSSLMKMECFVEFDGDPEIKESAIFLMPEQHPGIQGFETLIRTLIPLCDVFHLYGRPKRLNADKNDINSLLFGLPSLPKAYYLDVVDVFMLAALPDSLSWSSNEWNSKIKELIASKLAVGYKGSGNIHESKSPSLLNNDANSSLQTPGSIALGERQRAVSEPNGVPNLFPANSSGTLGNSYDANSSTSSFNKHSPAAPSPLQHSRPAPKAPTTKNVPTTDSYSSGTSSANNANSSSGLDVSAAVAAAGLLPEINQPSSSTNEPTLMPPESTPRGPRAEPPAMHQRVKSEGEEFKSGLLSPQLSDMKNGFGTTNTESAPYSNTRPDRTSRLTVASADSFASANETIDFSEKPSEDRNRGNLFDPTYRSAHQSYAAYSEYMHQYLKNMPQQNDNENATTAPAEATAPSSERESHTGTNSAYPSNQNRKPVARPTGGAIATAIEVSDDDDDDNDDDDDDDCEETNDYRAFLNDKLRPSTPPTAQLLSTPIRSPAISHTTPESEPITATRDVSTPQSTSLTGPRIPVYPNAPGSPGKGSSDSLQYPKPLNSSSEQRKPSGPRDEPRGSANVKAPSATTPMASPYSVGQQQQQQSAQVYRPYDSPATLDPAEPNPYRPAMVGAQQAQNQGQIVDYSAGPVPGQKNFASGPMTQNNPSYGTPGYGAPGYGAPGYGSSNQQPYLDPMVRYAPQGPKSAGQVPGPGPFGPASRNPFGPPGGWPNPYSNMGGNPQGMPASGNGLVGSGPRPMAAQGYGLRSPPTHNPYGAQSPLPQQPMGAAGKPGQQPRSFNEARAQQLKSMRAQAMGDGAFGI